MSFFKSTKALENGFDLQADCLEYDVVKAQRIFLFCPKTRPNIVIFYDFEAFERNRAKSYAKVFILFPKKIWKIDFDLTKEKIEKCQSDTVVLQDEDIIGQMFDYLKKKST